MPPLVVPMLVACGSHAVPRLAAAEPAEEEASVHVVVINDTYRIEGDPSADRGGLARVRTVRASLEAEHGPVLVLHAGDFLFPSFLSRTFQGAQMVDVLGRLDGDA